MKRRDAEDAEEFGVWSGSDDAGNRQIASAPRHDRFVSRGLSAVSASLRFILSVITG